MQISQEDFKRALSKFAAGVTIVTSTAQDGQPVGATVSAFASVSADPPLVLVCLHAASRSAVAIQESRAFNVHFLNTAQSDLAMRFASDQSDKFADLPYARGDLGAPCLSECDVRLECELFSQTPGGSHLVFIGSVRNAVVGELDPLVYVNRAFGSVKHEEPSLASQSSSTR